MLLKALISQDLKPFRKAQTWLINTVRKILFKLKLISGFLVFLVLFNLQSALFRSVIEGLFLTRSLERLFIIPRPFPFVNTFFQKNSIFLKFSVLYSFCNFSSLKIVVMNTFRYESGIFAAFFIVLIFRKSN